MDETTAGGAGSAALAEVRGYWEALRGPGREVPLRSTVDPRGIAGALDCAFIAERVAPGIARFRLAGSAICDLVGMDVRGMPMLTLIDPPSRAGFGRSLEAALTGPAILDMWLEAERGIGRPALSARLVMLPLRRADGGAGLALGALALTGGTGRPPRRFAVLQERLTPVAAGAAVGFRAVAAPGEVLSAAPSRPVQRSPARDRAAPMPAAALGGLAEAAAPFRPRAERPYLRLVKSDR